MIPLYSRVTHRHDRLLTGIVTRILSPRLVRVSWASTTPRLPEAWSLVARFESPATIDELVLLGDSSQAAPTSTSNLQQAA
jgi:hypothetical protein